MITPSKRVSKRALDRFENSRAQSYRAIWRVVCAVLPSWIGQKALEGASWWKRNVCWTRRTSKAPQDDCQASRSPLLLWSSCLRQGIDRKKRFPARALRVDIARILVLSGRTSARGGAGPSTCGAHTGRMTSPASEYHTRPRMLKLPEAAGHPSRFIAVRPMDCYQTQPRWIRQVSNCATE